MIHREGDQSAAHRVDSAQRGRIFADQLPYARLIGHGDGGAACQLRASFQQKPRDSRKSLGALIPWLREVRAGGESSAVERCSAVYVLLAYIGAPLEKPSHHFRISFVRC